jgi:hypothetical protein
MAPTSKKDIQIHLHITKKVTKPLFLPLIKSYTKLERGEDDILGGIGGHSSILRKYRGPWYFR